MTLADTIEANAEALITRSVTAMYENPFWKDRFGERGERFSREDHAHHIRYLVEAVRGERPAIVGEYARWLQTVLTTRGMCSLHIEESFLRVGDAIAAEGLDRAGEIGPFVAAATDALRYSAPDARALQDATSLLAAAATSTVRKGRPAIRDEAIDDARYQVAYAADAVALSDDKVFVGYVVWRADFLARQKLPVDALHALLKAFRDTPSELPSTARGHLSHLATSALTALETGAS